MIVTGINYFLACFYIKYLNSIKTYILFNVFLENAADSKIVPTFITLHSSSWNNFFHFKEKQKGAFVICRSNRKRRKKKRITCVVHIYFNISFNYMNEKKANVLHKRL